MDYSYRTFVRSAVSTKSGQVQILKREERGFRFIEVKSSTSVKVHHVPDVAATANRLDSANSAAQKAAAQTNAAASDLRSTRTLGDAMRERIRYEVQRGRFQDKLDELDAATRQADAVVNALERSSVGSGCAQRLASELQGVNGAVMLASLQPEEFKESLRRVRAGERLRREQELEAIKLATQASDADLDSEALLKRVEQFRSRHGSGITEAEPVLAAAERRARGSQARAQVVAIEQRVATLQELLGQARKAYQTQRSMRKPGRAPG